MRKFEERFISWCAEDTAVARLERTIAQGVIAIVVAGVTTGDWGVAALTGAIMAVLSPIQKAIGNKGEVE